MRPAAILFFFIALPLAGLEAKEVFSQDKDIAAYAGTLTWGVAYKPTIINPVFTTQSVSASLQGLIFNQLIRWNAKGKIEPDLAESWDISQDGLTYTFHLRKGVKFHDGVEFSAEDVKFTFDKIIDPQIDSPFRSFFELVKEFKVIDKYTFQVIINKPFPSFIFRLVRPIAPKHLLENNDLKNSPFNLHPVGTGPFKFSQWSKDGQITLEFNPDYYEGRPYLNSIVVKTYSDSRQLWQALMRQEVDLVLFLEREDFRVIKNDPAFKTYAIPVDYYYALSYNLEDHVLSDLRVRKAIAYGINRKELIDNIEQGHGLECNSPFYWGSIGTSLKFEPMEFDPARAMQILAEAGWQDADNDGIREKEDQDLEIRLLVDERNDKYRKIAMLIRQQLQGIGIKLAVQLYNDDRQLTPDFLVQKKSQAQIKLLLAGLDPDQIDTDWILQGPGNGYTLWRYQNPEVNRYFSLGKTTEDKVKSQWIYQELNRFIYVDQPVCFLYYPLDFHAVSSRFKDTDELFTLSMPFDTIRKWNLK
jgi:peptide/nickel transport system substrate-binding protein